MSSMNNVDDHHDNDTVSTTDRLPKQKESSYSDSTTSSTNLVRNSRKRTAGERQQASVVFHPDEALLTFLQARNLYESEAQSKLRRNVLTEFQTVLQNWASSIPTTTTTTTVVHVCTFGSYRLGVHNASSDIDALCLVPTHVTRHDFFTSFVQLLQQHRPVVTDLQPVPTAFTPVIKLKWKGIPVDLVFANYHTPSSTTTTSSSSSNNSTTTTEPKNSRLPLLDSSEEFQILDEHLIGLDEPSVRSLNGVRVAQMLLKLIPQEKMNDFRIVLRTVKEFASVHGVYSNVLGFLGGVNWAIMVVKIIQLFPKASAAQLIYQFFKTFSQWPWPKPVRIAAPTSPPPGVAPQVVWNPTIYPRDRTHIMPIITPAFPSMNSAYNVGQPQLRRIREELDRTAGILERILSRENMETGTHSWSEIMEDNVFFHRHGHYIQVRILANNAKDFRSWFGFCEARLRILIGNLESPERGVQAYPFARFFFRKIPRVDDEALHPPSDTNATKDNPATPMLHVSSFFVALRFAPGIESIDLTSSVQETLCKFNLWEDRRQGMDITIEHLLWNQLPGYVFEKNSSASTSDPGRDDESQTSSQQEGSGKRRNTSDTAGGHQP